MERYVVTQPGLQFVQRSIQLLQFGSTDSGKLTDQLLEYAPIQSITYLQNWLKSNATTTNTLALLAKLELLTSLPVASDLVSYTHLISAEVGMPGSFADSQVDILFFHAKSQNLLPLLNDCLPSNTISIGSTTKATDAWRLANIYDLCVHLSNMHA